MPQDVFTVGEKVKCILMGMDPDYSNISLSTAELEIEEGDITKNRQAVWDNAGGCTREGRAARTPLYAALCLVSV